MVKPTARKCAWCGKPKGVTFYAVQVAGQMKSVAAHPDCINKWRLRHGD